jgi:ATP-dependent RNA helicase DeaD
VGTPGRLLDHLQRQSIDLSQAGAVVLDEADRMLDLGFRDDLEAILALAPQGHRTHLVSATFPREVEALAQRIQSNPANVQGTPLGSANTDIDHIVHFVKPAERTDALVNLLLSAPGEQVLVFARTRADVARVRAELAEAGFSVASLSGEMEQDERHRALSAFKHGKLQVLVATDVAARGIDHQDVARVVQLEPPNDADTYTHRSGRTGRAGRKGKSSIMVAPAGWNRLAMLLKRARVRHRFEAIPTAQAIAAAQDERLFRELTGETPSETGAGEATRDARATALAARLLAAGQGERAIAELVVQTRRAARCEPRELTLSDQHGPGSGHRPARTARVAPPARAGGSRPPRREPAEPARRNRDEIAESWVRFRISWGETGGADARRLVPMLCRRGKIRGADIGAIRVAPDFSLVDVAQHVAGSFESATRRPDPRDPGVTVRREFGGADRAFERRLGARSR